MCQDNLTPGNNWHKAHINVREPPRRCSADRPPRVGLICGEKGCQVVSTCRLRRVCGVMVQHRTCTLHTHTPNRHMTSQRYKFLESRKQCGKRCKERKKKKPVTHTVVGRVRPCLSAQRAYLLCFALGNTHVQS